MTQKTPALDNQAIDDLFVASALSGFIVWPIAFGGMYGAMAAVGRDWHTAWIALGFGLVTTCVISLLPLAMFFVVKKILTRLQRYVLVVLLGLAGVANALTSNGGILFILGSAVFAQVIALLPACFSSNILVGIVLRALKALNARSLLSFALGGALGGLMPAIPLIAFEAMNSLHVGVSAEHVASIVGFWCIGGMAAMITVWIWWQFQRTRGATKALEHPPSDLPEPQLQP
jgi:hypothetical protein